MRECEIFSTGRGIPEIMDPKYLMGGWACPGREVDVVLPESLKPVPCFNIGSSWSKITQSITTLKIG